MAEKKKPAKKVVDVKPYLEQIKKLGGRQGAIAAEALAALK